MATRVELLQKTGNMPKNIDSIVKKCYENEEHQIWKEGLFGSPHGVSWFSSFHSSEFPGDNPKACARKALYGLMGIPDSAPASVELRTLADAGFDIEHRIVKRFERAGILLSNSPDEDHQTRVEDKEHWLSCSPDSVINIPGKNIAHPVEIKSKYQRVIDEMNSGQRMYDPKHRNQLLTQVGLLHEQWKEAFPQHKDIKPPSHGTIYYVSRDKPSDSYEFLFKHDPEFMEKGRKKLREWKKNYLEEELPERPKDWKWTEEPCKWCPVKKLCKQDVKDGVTKLGESATIALAKEVREGYDYKETRKEVLDRWGE